MIQPKIATTFHLTVANREFLRRRSFLDQTSQGETVRRALEIAAKMEGFPLDDLTPTPTPAA